VELRSCISNERQDTVDTSLKSFAENRRETDPMLDAIPSRAVAAPEQSRQQTLVLFGCGGQGSMNQ
jgi:hypothetical protein